MLVCLVVVFCVDWYFVGCVVVGGGVCVGGLVGGGWLDCFYFFVCFWGGDGVVWFVGLVLLVVSGVLFFGGCVVWYGWYVGDYVCYVGFVVYVWFDFLWY